ncbi:hypothetical protein G6553_00470 [Nocardioides sp. IC4_145]|uniref:hypothetical protein n=1 Tax=Nocardioides sp. IC4_145 TaxID=2714037 RepID=UPI001409ACFF|nr:hypothetical protein [Nocardioides sp. IC4_145]NHC21645.1 hypothetical protein [Nocardioides sp. IC4_145]
MTTASTPDPRLLDADLLSRDGTKVGKVGAVILDRDLVAPEFVSVRRSLLGGPACFVPVAGSRLDEGGDLVVPFDLATIDAAPQPELRGGTFDAAQAHELHAHYGTPAHGAPADPGR